LLLLLSSANITLFYNVIFQGELAYEVIGDLAAPSYFSVDSSGNIFVRSSLKTDFATNYTVSSKSIF